MTQYMIRLPPLMMTSTESSPTTIRLPACFDVDLASTSVAACASVSASACTPTSASVSVSAPAASLQNGTIGFDQASLLDEICTSALNTPFTPELDTPDHTPSQTPLFDCVASEDLDLTSFDLFWTAPSTPANVAATTPALSTTTMFPAVVPQMDTKARLQAENALLDFVLFDDIAPPSPISTLSTPMTAPITSPSVDLKETETCSLSIQLATPTVTLTPIQSSTPAINPAASPFVSGLPDVIGSLFSDVSLSPLSDTSAFSTPATSPISPPQLLAPQQVQDWTSTSMNQNFLFDFNATTTLMASDLGAPLASAQTLGMVDTTSSPSVDINLLLSLYSQQAATMATTVPNATTISTNAMSGLIPLAPAPCSTSGTIAAATDNKNPLKRKSSDEMQAGEESSRQFACAQCGRAFSRLFNLNTHERTHDRSKARLFACPEQGCKKSFTRKNDLQRHQISIHKITHIYSCKICDTPFQRKDALRRHMDEKSCVAATCAADAGDHGHSHSN
ncbi:hypothetical protein BGZ94_005773 [Podila epigama]|nr:hypothetical protein BGZ94_005773 [Podila epigama]